MILAEYEVRATIENLIDRIHGYRFRRNQVQYGMLFDRQLAPMDSGYKLRLIDYVEGYFPVEIWLASTGYGVRVKVEVWDNPISEIAESKEADRYKSNSEIYAKELIKIMS